MLPRTTGVGQSFPPSALFNCEVSTLPLVKGEPCSAMCSEASWILPHYAAIASPSHDTAKRFPVGKKKNTLFYATRHDTKHGMSRSQRESLQGLCNSYLGGLPAKPNETKASRSIIVVTTIGISAATFAWCLSQAKHVSGIQHTPSLTSDHGYLGYCHALLTQNNCSPDSSHSPNMGKPEISRPGSPHCWMREKEGVSVVLGQAYCQSRDNS